MAHDNNPSFRLTLTVADVNQILEALGRLPYARVYQLIGRIQQQAQAQLEAAETAPSPTPSNGAQPPHL